MRNQRMRFAGILAIGATILLISILIGTRLGDRVIVSADGKSNDVAVDLPTPVPVSSAPVPPSGGKWKKSHVVAVATDPAFPDPRLTPTPEPTFTPTPKPSPQGSGHPNGKPVQPQAQITAGPVDGPAFTPEPHAPSHSAPVKDAKPKTTDELGE